MTNQIYALDNDYLFKKIFSQEKIDIAKSMLMENIDIKVIEKIT